MVLWLAEQAKIRGLPHVYLGYWIANCAKMSYKAAFHPLQVFTVQGWHLLRAPRKSDKSRK
jgi:arginine-tRNA-protein transferase